MATPCVSCFSLVTGCGITFSSPWTNQLNILALSPTTDRGLRAVTASGCPFSAAGALCGAEELDFGFAWVSVSFVPAQVYSKEEGG